jgi:hypothetical protein
MRVDPDTRIVGNVKPSGFGEYDNLTGYLTREYSVEWEDSSGTRWRKTCTVINLGRPDRGVPVDTPEEEEWDEGGGVANTVVRAKRGAVLALLVEVLRAYGPRTTPQLAVRVGRARQAIQNTLTARVDLFMKVSGPSKRGVDTTWGLVGVHDKQEAA